MAVFVGAIAFHTASLFGLFLGARWLGSQRRLGHPDPRARIIDRRGVLLGLGAAWLWAQSIVVIGAVLLMAGA